MDEPIWGRFFSVFPLVLVGTREEDTGYDLAPKHMAMLMSWKNWFGFVCTPRHRTYHNIKEFGRFSVSFVKPDQVLMSSLAAMPRSAVKDFSEEITKQIPTIYNEEGTSIYLKDSYVMLDCRLYKVIDGFDDYSLICGKIESAWVDKDYRIISDEGQQDQIYRHPLLAYVAQGRFASIKKTWSYPYPKDFKR